MRGRSWERDEFIAAFNLYLKLPFGKMVSTNKDIRELAQLLDRTPNSIALRLVNFASCDPYHQNRGVKGMIGGIKQCQPIWDEFFNDRESLMFESERIIAEKQGLTIDDKFSNMLVSIKELKGDEKVREVKTRVNQNLFRQIVLANYNSKCAITGIDIAELLLASHIIPWSQNEKERLNPENGICLSALYDKAFDRGLIGIDSSNKIVLSPKIIEHCDKEYYDIHFGAIRGLKINMPQKYNPNPLFLEWHMDEVFVR